LRRIEFEGRDQDLTEKRRALAEQGQEKESGKVGTVEGESAINQFAGCQWTQINLGCGRSLRECRRSRR